MDKLKCYAACSFGLEFAVANELKAMGLEPHSQDARIFFEATANEIARVNLRLACADRVYLVLKQFKATTFDELFEGVKAINWCDYLSKHSSFPVLGDSVRSVLKSVPDIQRLGKKAIVESLKSVYGLSFYREDAEEKSVYISILADEVTVSLNTSGMGLNRRGYRVKNAVAPLRETLAAGLIRLTRWYDRPFYDIMCGSGTIAIEAALKAKNIAPNLNRRFSCESWSQVYAAAFASERRAARADEVRGPIAPIFAYDIDPRVLDMARYHAKRAGVENAIEFAMKDAARFSPATENGTIISNPPYAVRMGERDEVHALYASLGKALLPLSDFKYYFICSDEDFEKYFGKKCDKKRKLYNGNMKCNFYQYFR